MEIVSQFVYNLYIGYRPWPKGEESVRITVTSIQFLDLVLMPYSLCEVQTRVGKDLLKSSQKRKEGGLLFKRLKGWTFTDGRYSIRGKIKQEGTCYVGSSGRRMRYRGTRTSYLEFKQSRRCQGRGGGEDGTPDGSDAGGTRTWGRSPSKYAHGARG